MTSDENICPRCGSRDSQVTDNRSGEIVCQCCGLVFEERIIDDTYEKKVLAMKMEEIEVKVVLEAQ